MTKPHVKNSDLVLYLTVTVKVKIFKFAEIVLYLQFDLYLYKRTHKADIINFAYIVITLLFNDSWTREHLLQNSMIMKPYVTLTFE
jgi:hypothetical protein